MELGRIETYYGLKLFSLGEHCSSRQCQKVSQNSGGIREVSAFLRIWEKSRNLEGVGGSGSNQKSKELSFFNFKFQEN